MNADMETPTLLLSRDHYAIETVVNVGLGLWVVWMLLYQDEYGIVQSVASGWRMSYKRARVDAFNAYVTHSSWTSHRKSRDSRTDGA